MKKRINCSTAAESKKMFHYMATHTHVGETPTRGEALIWAYNRIKKLEREVATLKKMAR
jgi:hypothetical protein